MKVLVCGGRDFADAALVDFTLSSLDPSPTTIIHGGSRGADDLGCQWAKDQWRRGVHIPVECFVPAWETHGRAAGPIRNQRMIDEGLPDLVVAFPGGRGTADMIRRAQSAGIAVHEVAR